MSFVCISSTLIRSRGQIDTKLLVSDRRQTNRDGKSDATTIPSKPDQHYPSDRYPSINESTRVGEAAQVPFTAK